MRNETKEDGGQDQGYDREIMEKPEALNLEEKCKYPHKQNFH